MCILSCLTCHPFRCSWHIPGDRLKNIYMYIYICIYIRLPGKWKYTRIRVLKEYMRGNGDMYI